MASGAAWLGASLDSRVLSQGRALCTRRAGGFAPGPLGLGLGCFWWRPPLESGAGDLQEGYPGRAICKAGDAGTRTHWSPQICARRDGRYCRLLAPLQSSRPVKLQENSELLLFNMPGNQSCSAEVLLSRQRVCTHSIAKPDKSQSPTQS